MSQLVTYCSMISSGNLSNDCGLSGASIDSMLGFSSKLDCGLIATVDIADLSLRLTPMPGDANGNSAD